MPRPRPSAPSSPVAPARRTTVALAAIAALALGAATSATGPAAAFFDEPAPKIDCRKKENRSKPQCKQARVVPRSGGTQLSATSGSPAATEASSPQSAEIFFAAYGLARAGQYAAARDILRLGDQSDPRVLNYTGFVTRKLGDVDGALPYYRRALAIDPDYVLARAYMGEAHVQRGDLASARAELGEIERRCGRVCAEYVDLAMSIAGQDGIAVGEASGRGG